MTVYRGTVSGFAPRTESGVFRRRQTLVWSYRLERRGANREPLPRVAVEMRGKYFTGGSVNNGDIVQVSGRQAGNGLVGVRLAKNLSARTTVRAHSWNASVVVVYLVLLALFVAAVAGLAYVFVLDQHLPNL